MIGGMGNDTIIGGYEDDYIIGGPDLDGVNLKDAILCLRILKGEFTEIPVFVEADINQDKKLGIQDVIYILRIIAYEL